MVELVFSDSACGSLKMAQGYGGGEYIGGATGVVVMRSDGKKPTRKELKEAQIEAEEQERLAWESAAPLGGRPKDVYGLSLALSIGDISENIPGEKRFDALEHLYSVYPEEIGRDAAEDIHRAAKAALEEIRGRIENGEALRIWYSTQPDELCGLYWFMSQMQGWNAYSGNIMLVKLPEWEADENGGMKEWHGLGELPPGRWHKYLSLAKEAPPAFCKSCAEKWRELQKENAPLRAVLNGRLSSVAEDIYDGFIEREIAAEGEVFNEAGVIGRVLGKYNLGIGDAWLALRIEEMIKRGVLEPVNKAAKGSPVYHRSLRKLESI